MARSPTNLIELSARLRPVAAPVDTFVKPARSPLRGLVESLATWDRNLAKLLETRDKAEEEKQATLGRAAFYQDGSGEMAKMVTEGTIPAQYSPYYVKGFKQAQGAAAGEGLRTKWQDAWDNWDGKDSDDPNAFNEFFHGFIRDNVGSKDPDVLAGVLPTVEALQANATTQYTQYRHDQTVNGETTAHGAIISGSVQDGLDDGAVSDKGADYQTIFGNVNTTVANSLKLGDPGGKKVDTFIDVMSAKILETKDPKLLEWFDQKVPGKDYTYGQTPHGLEVKNATVNSLETLARQQAAGLTAAEKQEMERKKDEAQSGIIDGILKNPGAPFDDKLLKQAKDNGDPLIEVHAREWRDSLGKAEPSDPTALQGFYGRVIAGEMRPNVALQDALSNGVFSNADDLKAAVTFVQGFQTVEDTITRAQSSGTFTSIIEAIRVRTQAKAEDSMPITGWSNEGFEASSDFRQLVARWIIEHPSATLPEIDEQISKLGKMVTSRLKLPAGADAISGVYEYSRDPKLPFANAWTTNEAGNISEASPQPTADSDILQWEKANGITPQQKAALEAAAAKSGMTYSEFVRERALTPAAR